ncbi:MAG: hypothetical protein FWF40_01075 [Methanomassiliicoccaceae archaeon]|jgi:hypothetical protein|nr:hypothetical protein [Methanomassiliicoccaceae archaeon]
MKIPKFKKKEKEGISNITFEDGMLFADCRSCGGASDLGDAVCVKCISGAISNNGVPSRLMMRKVNDSEYSEDVISVLNDISKIGSLITAAASERTNGKCSGRQCSIPKNASDIWDSFPEPRFDVMRLDAERSIISEAGCEECLWRTIGFIDQAETMFSDVRKKAAKIAFRLTEV